MTVWAQRDDSMTGVGRRCEIDNGGLISGIQMLNKVTTVTGKTIVNALEVFEMDLSQANGTIGSHDKRSRSRCEVKLSSRSR